MNWSKETYKKYADAHAPRSPIGKNCLNAFCIGGLICAIAQGFNDIYSVLFGIEKEDAGLLASITLVFNAAEPVFTNSMSELIPC